MSNYNSFTGRQVVPQYIMDTKSGGFQSEEYTNEFAKFAGEKLNWSPIKIEHVLRGYGGTIGGYLFDVIDVGLKSEFIKGDTKALMPSRPWYDYPVIKRWFGKEHAKGQQQDVYDLYREVNKAVTTLRSLQTDGRLDEAEAYIKGREMLLSMRGSMSSLKNIVSRTRQQRDRIIRSDLTADQKKYEIDRIDMYLNAMLRDVVPHMKEAADLPFWESLFYDDD